MIFKNVKDLTLPNGKIKKLSCDSRVLWQKQAKVLLSFNRIYVSGVIGENLVDYLDENKAFLNTVYGSGTFYDGACTANNITENSVTIKEPGIGGITTGYPVLIADIDAEKVKLSFDYAGTGKARVYYRTARKGSYISNTHTILNVSTAGESGHIDCEIPISGFEWIVFFLGSNTGGTSVYTNVSLTPK